MVAGVREQSNPGKVIVATGSSPRVAVGEAAGQPGSDEGGCA